MFTPNHEKLVTTLPKIAMIIRPRCRMNPPQRACKMIAHQRTISTAPFSFGSQPQKRPHDHQAALPDESAPACMQNDRAPKNDQHRAVFFRVPAPETAPRLVGPDSAEHSADKTK